MPRLHEYLASNTERTYESRLLQLDTSSKRGVVESFKVFLHGNPPLGTALPTRAAALRALMDLDPELSQQRADELLPALSGLKSGKMRFALSDEQLGAYYAAVEKRCIGSRRVALLLLPQTGLRPSEMCALRKEHVRVVPRGFDVEVHGKSKEGRIVHVRKKGAAVLRVHLGTLSGEWLFPGKKAGTHMTEQVLQHAVTGYINRKKPFPGIAADIKEPRLTPYVLRHTFATQLLKAGASLPRIAAMMGHESTKTTESYLHLVDAEGEAFAEKIAQE